MYIRSRERNNSNSVAPVAREVVHDIGVVSARRNSELPLQNCGLLRSHKYKVRNTFRPLLGNALNIMWVGQTKVATSEQKINHVQRRRENARTIRQDGDSPSQGVVERVLVYIDDQLYLRAVELRHDQNHELRKGHVR